MLIGKNLNIYIKTTGTCNLDCHHCFTSGGKGKKIYFNPQKTIDFIENLVISNDIRSLRLLYHGGEPMLAPL